MSKTDKEFRVVTHTFQLQINFQDYRCGFSIEKTLRIDKYKFKLNTRKT
jgi:hypothetical protein